MNSDALVQIFVAIIASLPALIGIFSTFMKPYDQKPFDLSDRSFARVLRIQRRPLDEKEWLFLRRQYVIDIITPLFVFIFIASITLLVIAIRHISLFLSVIFFIVASIYISCHLFIVFSDTSILALILASLGTSFLRKQQLKLRLITKACSTIFRWF
jgi:hypothetical protein